MFELAALCEIPTPSLSRPPSDIVDNKSNERINGSTFVQGPDAPEPVQELFYTGEHHRVICPGLLGGISSSDKILFVELRSSSSESKKF